MDERMWERYGATAGILFVVFILASVFLTSAPPHIDASVDKIVSYVGDHRKAILTEQVLGTFAVVFLLWFTGHLRHVLERAEGGSEALSPIVFGSGIALSAAGALAALPLATLAFGANQTEMTQNAALVRALWNANQMVFAVMFILMGLFAAVTGLAMVRKELVAPWLGWAGMLVALVDWVAGIAMFYTSTYNSFWNAMLYIGMLGFVAFVLVTSILMVRQPEVVRSPQSRPVFTH